MDNCTCLLIIFLSGAFSKIDMVSTLTHDIMAGRFNPCFKWADVCHSRMEFPPVDDSLATLRREEMMQ
jgi:hypothetical protein